MTLVLSCAGTTERVFVLPGLRRQDPVFWDAAGRGDAYELPGDAIILLCLVLFLWWQNKRQASRESVLGYAHSKKKTLLSSRREPAQLPAIESSFASFGLFLPP